MALTDENGGIGATMLVQPSGFNGGSYGVPYAVPTSGGFGGFGGDFGGFIVLFLIAAMFGGFGGGWGGFGGNGMMNYDFPWLLNGQNGINNNVNGGFRDAQLHDSITSVRDGVSNLAIQLCGCCGDMQMSMANGFAGVQNALCSGFAGTTAAVNGAQNAISQQMYNNEIANLNRSFAEQTANAQGFNNVVSGIADLRYTEATEACATRTASANNTRDIIDSQTRGTQAILDKLCALELDGYKREADNLRQQLNMSQLAASQTAQTAQILAGQAAEIDGVYNRLKNCPVPSMPVYGNTPIFTCNGNSGCGCGGYGFANG